MSSEHSVVAQLAEMKRFTMFVLACEVEFYAIFALILILAAETKMPKKRRCEKAAHELIRA